MADDERKIEHESFGLLSFSRVQSNVARHLFGSSIKHQNTIRLRINRAEEHRSLNRFWFFQRKQIIEIELSYSQFTEAITSMNTSGVPCTILYVEGKEMEDCPGESQRELFEREFEGKVRDITDTLLELQKETFELLHKKGTFKVSDKEKLKSLVSKITREVRQNIPFVQKSYNEAIDKTTMEAKTEIESFINHQIHTLGLEEFKKQFKLTEDELKFIEDKSNKD